MELGTAPLAIQWLFIAHEPSYRVSDRPTCGLRPQRKGRVYAAEVASWLSACQSTKSKS